MLGSGPANATEPPKPLTWLVNLVVVAFGEAPLHLWCRPRLTLGDDVQSGKVILDLRRRECINKGLETTLAVVVNH